jgi:hypothetical protein
VPSRATLAAFAAACALLVVFFHQGLSGNGASRLMTVFSLTHDHSYVGDRYEQWSWDKALVDGHWHSDKAPLSSYVVLPFYFAWRHAGPAPKTRADAEAANHLALVVAAVVPFAIFAALLWWRLAAIGVGGGEARDAPWLVLFALFGTHLYNYGNSYFGHLLAGLFLVGSWALAIDLRRRPMLAGLLAGCAVATEYPTAVAVAFIVGALAVPRDRRRELAPFLVGALPPALLFFAHNALTTGHVYELPYSYVADNWKPMQHAFGMRLLPRRSAEWGLSLSPHRGIFFYGPVLILLCAALIRCRRWLPLAAAVAYFLVICCYYTWEGGWCTGPRHLTPPAMIIVYEGLVAFAPQTRNRRGYYLLGAIGVAVNLAFAATNPLPSAFEKLPLFRLAIPDFVAGRINAHNLPTEILGVAPHRWLVVAWLALFVGCGLLFAGIAASRARHRAATPLVENPH